MPKTPIFCEGGQLKEIKVVVGGETKRITVCTGCGRATFDGGVNWWASALEAARIGEDGKYNPKERVSLVETVPSNTDTASIEE